MTSSANWWSGNGVENCRWTVKRCPMMNFLESPWPILPIGIAVGWCWRLLVVTRRGMLLWRCSACGFVLLGLLVEWLVVTDRKPSTRSTMRGGGRGQRHQPFVGPFLLGRQFGRHPHGVGTGRSADGPDYRPEITVNRRSDPRGQGRVQRHRQGSGSKGEF